MLAHPPNTFWQDAACSLAEPSPGFTAKIVLPIPIFSLVISVYFVWIESKKELQLLLERTEEKPLYTLKVSVLLMEMVKDKPKYREVVYRRNTENRWNRDV